MENGRTIQNFQLVFCSCSFARLHNDFSVSNVAYSTILSLAPSPSQTTYLHTLVISDPLYPSILSASLLKSTSSVHFTSRRLIFSSSSRPFAVIEIKKNRMRYHVVLLMSQRTASFIPDFWSCPLKMRSACNCRT